ncbi:MAG: hypothetical protein ACKOGA_04730, partial [Planctomycetaceae bacterium]
LNLNDPAFTDSVLRQLRERNDRQIAEVFWRSWSRTSPELAQRVDRMFGFSPEPSTVVDPAPRLIDTILDRAISFLWRLNLVGDAGLTAAFGPDDAPASSETKLSVTPNEDVLTATFSANEYDDRDFPAGAVLVEAIDPVAEGERVVAHRLMRIQPFPDSKQFSGKVDLLEWKESPHNQLPREFRGPYRASLLANSNQQRLKGIPLTEIQRYEKMISHIPNLVQELHELTAGLDASLTH